MTYLGPDALHMREQTFLRCCLSVYDKVVQFIQLRNASAFSWQTKWEWKFLMVCWIFLFFPLLFNLDWHSIYFKLLLSRRASLSKLTSLMSYLVKLIFQILSILLWFLFLRDLAPCYYLLEKNQKENNRKARWTNNTGKLTRNDDSLALLWGVTMTTKDQTLLDQYALWMLHWEWYWILHDKNEKELNLQINQ